MALQPFELALAQIDAEIEDLYRKRKQLIKNKQPLDYADVHRPSGVPYSVPTEAFNKIKP